MYCLFIKNEITMYLHVKKLYDKMNMMNKISTDALMQPFLDLILRHFLKSA